MNKENILINSLRDLDLSGFDSTVYLTLFQKGQLSVTALARILKVERPTIYAALERLRQHGLLPAQRESFARLIAIESPSRIFDLLEERRIILRHHAEDLEDHLPLLLAEFVEKGRLSAFRLFEGRQQFLSVFEEALREAQEEILYYGNAQAFIDYVGLKYEKSWIRRRVSRSLKIRILVFRSILTEEFDRTDHKELRETRFLPLKGEFKSSFMVYGTKTLLWNPAAERAIVIDDLTITEMFKLIFELGWRSTKSS